jgi:RNA polymerase sigma factor (sigma-70 family)
MRGGEQGEQLAGDRPDRLRTAMERVAAGDQAAMRDIYDLTSAKLFGICLRILGDRGEAEDAMQDVYLSLWRRAASFDPARASPISWLACFARNRAIDRLRSASRVRATASIDEAEAVADGRPGAFALVAERQESARLHGCLDALDERQRGAIRSAFLDGFTYSELATRSETPLGTVKSWIRRGLTQLKACLER